MINRERDRKRQRQSEIQRTKEYSKRQKQRPTKRQKYTKREIEKIWEEKYIYKDIDYLHLYGSALVGRF